MKQYGLVTGKEYKPDPWNVAKARSYWLIIVPDDAVFGVGEEEQT